MPLAQAADGTDLHWEARGTGPAVVLMPYWSYAPDFWEPVSAELERDHRLIRYDDRGTGRSERRGPYDLATAAADLEAVLGAADAAPVVALAVMDGINRAVRVAAPRPDLISHVVGSGGAPIARSALAGSDSMIASNTVVAAFMQQLATDYRGAVRGVVEAANPKLSGDELRARVAAQVEHVPLEAAAPRVRDWADDADSEEPARALGERLVVQLNDSGVGGWFPEAQSMVRLLREHLPHARIDVVPDGLYSRPDLAASTVRELEAADVQSTS